MPPREPEPIWPADPEPPHHHPALHWLLGLVLTAAVILIGSPALDAPWIQGDERIFIANNPDVTGPSPSKPAGFRGIDIFLHTHEDL
jgi:hypothetical protein